MLSKQLNSYTQFRLSVLCHKNMSDQDDARYIGIAKLLVNSVNVIPVQIYRVLTAVSADGHIVSWAVGVSQVSHRYWRLPEFTGKHSQYVVAFTENHGTVACHSSTTKTRPVSHVHLQRQHFCSTLCPN